MSIKPIVLRLGKVQHAFTAWEELAKIADVITVPASTTREEFFKLLKDPSSKFSKISVITRTFGSVVNTGLFDKELANALPQSVIAVCHTGAGYDQIDAKAFSERKIQVANIPGIVNDATAVTHVFLLLGALRNYNVGHHNLIDGKWPATGGSAGTPFGHDPTGKIVGTLGLGGIGRAVVSRLQPFGFGKFTYHNRNKLPTELENGCEYVSFDELLRSSDIISINVPLNAATHHIIDADAISKMKDGVVIVNTARGAVIDEKALIAAVKSGKVRAAGLDVFEFEPKVSQELLDLPQIFGLPHMGTLTIETRLLMEEHVVQNALTVIKTGKVKSIVPEIKNDKWFLDL